MPHVAGNFALARLKSVPHISDECSGSRCQSSSRPVLRSRILIRLVFFYMYFVLAIHSWYARSLKRATWFCNCKSQHFENEAFLEIVLTVGPGTRWRPCWASTYHILGALTESSLFNLSKIALRTGVHGVILETPEPAGFLCIFDAF